MKNHVLTFIKATALVVAMGYSSSIFANTDGIVAIVDNGVVLKSELDQGVELFKQQLTAQNQPIPPVQFMRKQVLDQLILRQAQKNLALRYGIRISENELNNALLEVAKQSGIQSLEAFQQDLDSKKPNMYLRLREKMAEDLSIQRLTQQMVVSRIKISDQDVENFLKSPAGQASIGIQVHAIHVRISGQTTPAIVEQVKQELAKTSSVATLNQLSQNQVQIQATDLGWKPLSEIPAELAVRASNLQVGQVSEVIQGQDGSLHFIKVIDRKAGAEKVVVPQYHTRHILIQPSTVVSQEMAQQMINRIYQRVQQGEDFATLAATFSTDTGTARDGGSLGWVNLGTMVPEFEATMKATPVGQISQPFQTQYGWHILTVTDTRQHDMTNEYQRRMARQSLGESQFETELDSWLREVRAGAYVEIKDASLK